MPPFHSSYGGTLPVSFRGKLNLPFSVIMCIHFHLYFRLQAGKGPKLVDFSRSRIEASHTVLYKRPCARHCPPRETYTQSSLPYYRAGAAGFFRPQTPHTPQSPEFVYSRLHSAPVHFHVFGVLTSRTCEHMLQVAAAVALVKQQIGHTAVTVSTSRVGCLRALPSA